MNTDYYFYNVFNNYLNYPENIKATTTENWSFENLEDVKTSVEIDSFTEGKNNIFDPNIILDPIVLYEENGNFKKSISETSFAISEMTAGLGQGNFNKEMPRADQTPDSSPQKSSNVKCRKWTSAEIDKLTDAFQQYGKNPTLIAETCFEGSRSSYAVLAMINRMLKEKKLPQSSMPNTLLNSHDLEKLESVNISSHSDNTSKSEQQIKTKKNYPWSEAEINKLKDSYHQFGKDYVKIQESLPNPRSLDAVRLKVYEIEKGLNQEETTHMGGVDLTIQIETKKRKLNSENSEMTKPDQTPDSNLEESTNVQYRKWSSSEIDKLTEAFKLHSKNPQLIAEQYFGGRRSAFAVSSMINRMLQEKIPQSSMPHTTLNSLDLEKVESVNISSHSNNTSKSEQQIKIKKNVPWSEAEINKLKDSYREFGKDYVKIQENLPIPRSVNAIQFKVYQLEKDQLPSSIDRSYRKQNQKEPTHIDDVDSTHQIETKKRKLNTQLKDEKNSEMLKPDEALKVLNQNINLISDTKSPSQVEGEMDSNRSPKKPKFNVTLMPINPVKINLFSNETLLEEQSTPSQDCRSQPINPVKINLFANETL